MIFWILFSIVIVLSVAIAITEWDGFFQAVGHFFLGIVFLGLCSFLLIGVISFFSATLASPKVLEEYGLEGSVVLTDDTYYADTGTVIPEISEDNAKPTTGETKVYRVQQLDNSGIVAPWDISFRDPYYTLEYNPDDLEIRG